MSEYDALVEQIRGCTLCTLHAKRTMTVPGEGSLSADIMFIGEGPGFYEDQQGRPLCGSGWASSGGAAGVDRPETTRRLHNEHDQMPRAEQSRPRFPER